MRANYQGLVIWEGQGITRPAGSWRIYLRKAVEAMPTSWIWWNSRGCFWRWWQPDCHHGWRDARSQGEEHQKQHGWGGQTGYSQLEEEWTTVLTSGRKTSGQFLFLELLKQDGALQVEYPNKAEEKLIIYSQEKRNKSWWANLARI